jgi:hypothetical protein
MDDTALIFHFEQHLKPDVRKLLLANPLSGAWPDLQTLVDAAVKADCKLYETPVCWRLGRADTLPP